MGHGAAHSGTALPFELLDRQPPGSAPWPALGESSASQIAASLQFGTWKTRCVLRGGRADVVGESASTNAFSHYCTDNDDDDTVD